MSVFIYVHRHPLRTYQEFYTKIVYLITALAMFSALLVTFTLWITKINNTFENYWGNRSFELTMKMQAVLESCEWGEGRTVRIGGRRVSAVINPTNRQYFIMSAVELQNTVFGVAWPAVVLSIINKLLYRENWWFIRWYGMLIRTNIILPTIEIFFHVWSIVAIVKTLEPCSYMNDYFDSCADQKIPDVQGRVDHCFSLSLVGLLVVLCVNMFIIALALIRLACDAAEPENRRWAEVRYGDFHRKAKKGIPGIHGDNANDELVPPKRGLLAALDYYPELLRDHEADAERRCDVDGRLYTKKEFIAHYGGSTEWEHAPAAPPAQQQQQQQQQHPLQSLGQQPGGQHMPSLHDDDPYYKTYSPASVVPDNDPSFLDHNPNNMSPPRNPPTSSEV